MTQNKSYNSNNRPRCGKHPSFNRKSKYCRHINSHKRDKYDIRRRNAKLDKKDPKKYLYLPNKPKDDELIKYCDKCTTYNENWLIEQIFNIKKSKIIKKRTILPKSSAQSILKALRPRLFKRIVGMYSGHLPQNICKNREKTHCICENTDYADQYLYRCQYLQSLYTRPFNIQHSHEYNNVMFSLMYQLKQCKNCKKRIQCEERKRHKAHEEQEQYEKRKQSESHLVQLCKALKQHRNHTTVPFHIEKVETVFHGQSELRYSDLYWPRAGSGRSYMYNFF
jgi:hypothetical protein